MPLSRVTLFAGLSTAMIMITMADAVASGYAILLHSARPGKCPRRQCHRRRGPDLRLHQPGGLQAIAGSTLIAPHAASRDAVGTTAAGTPTGGCSGGDDATPDAIVPSFFGLVPLGEDLRPGLAVTMPCADPGKMDGEAEMKADDGALGFNLGLLFEPTERLRLGAAYRSRVRHDLDGDAEFKLDSASVGAALAGATGTLIAGRRQSSSRPAPSPSAPSTS